jgi:signal transduction histidine kinase
MSTTQQDLHAIYGDEPLSILIIEDVKAHFEYTSEMLRFAIPHPIEIDWAVAYEDALKYLHQCDYAVCLVDYHLGEYVGTQIIEDAQERGCTVPMILLTGQGDREIDLQAMASGATDYLDKSALKPATLERAVRYAIRNARASEQAQELAAHEERQRLARELHDAVSQTLFSANVIAETLPRLLDANPDAARDGLHQLADLTRGALAEMRTLLVELRPRALIETELDVLFQHLVAGLRSRTKSRIVFDSAGNRYLLSPEAQVAFYRIAQEGINNAIKHAKSNTIHLELVYKPDEVTMRISDDGIGFEPNDIPANHLGVKIMQERAENARLAFRLKSIPEEGTHLEIKWTQEPS